MLRFLLTRASLVIPTFFGVTLLNWRHGFSDLFRWNDAISFLLALVCLGGLARLLAQAAQAELRTGEWEAPR